MTTDFRSKLRRGERLYGTMLTLPSPAVAELLALVGFDWLFVDGEHGPFETSDIQAVLQAVGERSACLVRVPAIDPIPTKKALDLGAAGVIVPQVNNADEATAAVSYCRYPPAGVRGMGLARAHGYGVNATDYVSSANDRVVVVLQAEHRDAVENIEEIVRVPGIDCILIGPNDLSASYGKLGQFDDPEIVEAIRRVELACRSADLPLGIFGVSAEAVRPYLDRGFNLIVAGIDTLSLVESARQLLGELKR